MSRCNDTFQFIFLNFQQSNILQTTTESMQINTLKQSPQVRHPFKGATFKGPDCGMHQNNTTNNGRGPHVLIPPNLDGMMATTSFRDSSCTLPVSSVTNNNNNILA